MRRGREFMWQVRYALHMITDREEDRLLFDHQRELAELWGFEDGDKLAVEQFMQTYYRWALALGQLNEVLIQNFDQAILRPDTADDIRVLNDRFQFATAISRRAVMTCSTRHPLHCWKYSCCAPHQENLGYRAPTIRLIRNHRHLIDDAFRADQANQDTFLDILDSPNKMAASCGA